MDTCHSPAEAGWGAVLALLRSKLLSCGSGAFAPLGSCAQASPMSNMSSYYPPPPPIYPSNKLPMNEW